MKRALLVLLVIALVMVFMVPVATGKTFKGVAADPLAPQLGDITYLGNPAGYDFWFTPTGDLGPYTGGNSYHNVYKYKPQWDGPQPGWCGTTMIPDRAPYNLVGFDVGTMFYYKIINVTTGGLVCP
jgi:hypothetical protein